MSSYRHTQTSPLLPAFVVAGLGSLVASYWYHEQVLRTVCLTMAAVAGLFAGMFTRLHITEQADHLRVRFGPLPWGGTSVRYGHVRGVRRARSSLLDGWGIHWFPGRGWTFNLWGMQCVELQTDRGLVRLGTDDPDGLVQHLVQRTGVPAG
jgi:hypothetical protein